MKDHQTRESPSHTTAHTQAVTIAAAGADKETASNWGGNEAEKNKNKTKGLHACTHLFMAFTISLFIYLFFLALLFMQKHGMNLH